MIDSRKFALKIFKKEEIKELINVSSLSRKHKIVVFVPPAKVKEIILSMAEKGAGIIGNYTVCSFRINGTSTFKGGKKSNPVIGKKQKLETAEEVRLEMVCDNDVLGSAIRNMLKHHPYEEPAYEIYDIASGTKFSGAVNIVLIKPVRFKEIIKRINSRLNIEDFVSDANVPVKNVLVDLNNDKNAEDYLISNKGKTLYINKKNKGEINLMLK